MAVSANIWASGLEIVAGRQWIANPRTGVF